MLGWFYHQNVQAGREDSAAASELCLHRELLRVRLHGLDSNETSDASTGSGRAEGRMPKGYSHVLF